MGFIGVHKRNTHLLIERQICNALVLLSIDCIMLLLSLYLGDLVLYLIHGIPVSIQYSVLLLPVWCVGALASGQVPGWGLGAIEELRRIQLLILVVFAFAGIAVFMMRGFPSRIVYLTAYLTSAVCIPFGRIFCRKWLTRIGQWGCAVALYGDRTTIDRLLNVLREEISIGFYPCGIFSDDFLDVSSLNGVPVLGRLEESTDKAAVAVASIAHIRNHNLVEFVDHTLSDYHKVVLFPDINEGVFSWVTPRDFGGLIGLEIARNLLHPLAGATKRILDLFWVVITTPIWLSLLVLLALLVFLDDRHNPFYTQIRVGRRGRQFRAIKLRTMVQNADQELENVLEKNPALKEEWEHGFKLQDDPRITVVGKLLRRLSLDEFPQLINVLLGQMALVGPRPLPEYHHGALSESAVKLRNRVLPGITGLWQISGRSDCSQLEMEQLDSFYVRNWSIWMDLYVLAKTLRAVISSHGAY